MGDNPKCLGCLLKPSILECSCKVKSNKQSQGFWITMGWLFPSNLTDEIISSHCIFLRWGLLIRSLMSNEVLRVNLNPLWPMMFLKDEEREWWKEDAVEVQVDDTTCKPSAAASEENSSAHHLINEKIHFYCPSHPGTVLATFKHKTSNTNWGI